MRLDPWEASRWLGSQPRLIVDTTEKTEEEKTLMQRSHPQILWLSWSGVEPERCCFAKPSGSMCRMVENPGVSHEELGLRLKEGRCLSLPMGST